MSRISRWNDLVTAIGPHLMTDNPLDSLRSSGVEFDGEVAAALNTSSSTPPSHRELMARLRATYGVLPTTLHVGRAPQEPPPTKTTGFALVATTHLSVLNDVLAEMWRVGTIPHELTDAQTNQVVELGQLRATCSGVPDDAELGHLQFTSPPVVAASSISQRNVRLDVMFNLPLLGSQPTRLSGVLRMEVGLDFQVHDSVVRPAFGGVNEAPGSLEIHALSPVRPASEQSRQLLETKFVNAGRIGLLGLTQGPDAPVQFKVSIPVHKSRFPNSTIDITQMAAVTIRQSGRDYAVIGVNVEQVRDVNPVGLIGQLTPTAPNTLRAVVDEQFASDALSAIIASGDLAAFFNRVIARHSPITLTPVEVEDGYVSFTDGKLQVLLDCVWVDACIGTKDLKFTATVLGWPTIENGRLTITGSSIDFDLDNTDAVLCALTGALFGPFGIVFNLFVTGFLASYNPNSSELDIPVSETSDPLPGSDKVLDVNLTSAAMETDVLTSEGGLALISDPLRIYAYLRVVEQLALHEKIPLAGVNVTLYELDFPPPPGDDVVDPSSYTEIVTNKFQVTEEVIYNPQADELLGTATTDKNGRVTFIVISDMLGGSLTRTTASENFRTGNVSITVRHELVGEALPDLGASVRTAQGTPLAGKRLIGLNVVNRRFGRFDQPIDVVVKPMLGEPGIDPQPTTSVPDVLELGASLAIAQIRSAGLMPLGTSSAPNAWVFRQNPAGGRVVPLGSTVTLTFRTGPRP
jgi:hypothetical protein